MKSPYQQGIDTWQRVALQAAANAEAPAPFMEHRWGVRRPCRARVHVYAGGGLAGPGRLRNVSISGAFLETPVTLPLFSQVSLTVVGEDGALQRAELTASVVRVAADGVGLEWEMGTFLDF